ncbi:MAG: ABC transporter ATP-binding protein [Coxiellaceae bacterium]|nr:ABC transporter ATP-binding protein [Coxiellaceae bacterium]
MKTIIQAEHISKHYGDFQALSDVNFAIKPGSIVGLIGPNGAGKTTLLKAIFGLTPYQGELMVNGLSPTKQHVALMHQMCFIADVATLPRWMKVSQAISYVEGVHPKFQREKAMGFLNKTNIPLDQRIKALSKGMMVQLHLALVMAIDVNLLILDEPTLGLDILYRKKFYDSLLNDYFNEHKTIVITTHQVEEVEAILTDLIVIDRGCIKLNVSIDDYREQFSELVVTSADQASIQALKPIYSSKQLSGTKYIFRNADKQQLQQLGEVTVPNVSDVFLAMVDEGVGQ